MNIFDFSDRVEKAAGTCLEVIEKALANMDGGDVSPANVKSIMCLSNSLSAVSRSAADLERSTRERSHICGEVSDQLKAEVRLLLAGHPDLNEACVKVIEEAKTKLISKLDSSQSSMVISPGDTAKGRKKRATQKLGINSLALPAK